MPRDFDALAARAKEGWSRDTHAVYEAAGEVFEAEIDQQPETDSDPDQ